VVGDPVKGQAMIGYLNATAGIILALTAPFLGAIADKNGRRKPWILITILIMACGSFALWFVKPGGAGLGIYPALFVLLVVSVAQAISEVFHNAMMPSITPANKLGLVSGLAYSVGNIGGLGLMLFVLIAFSLPGNIDWAFLPSTTLFGIDQGAEEHNRIVGPIAAVWMLVMTLPVMLFTPDGKSSGTPMWQAARTGVKDVINTMKQLKHYSNIAIYLLGRMFFIDGMVGVMTFGGVYASGTFDWGTTELLILGLVTSSSAMIGAFFGGKMDDLLGSIRTLQISIAMSSLLLVALVSIQPDAIGFFIEISTAPAWQFPYFVSAAELWYFGLMQVFAIFFVTGLSSSRTLMARIAPPEMMTQFFGLFALSGTVTAFLAPLLVATTTTLFQSQRAGMASLIILMVIGSVLLLKVREVQSKVATKIA
jgi:UMF1 family MFS transporter